MREPLVLRVSQLNAYVRSKLDEDPNLTSVFVTGEISNFTCHSKSGHLYFSLKDERAVLRAVMFVRQASRLRFLPKDGMKVLARGRVSLYEAAGQYQITVEDMQPDGLGALNLAFEQLKEKLAAEGLFAAERKRPLPAYPQSIGVITSPTGAAVHDILTVLGRRWPAARIVFCPVLVQGEGAAAQLVHAVERMNACACADVILLGRGGGSIEDLWAFNEESVARAVAASRIPVVSAVGHETDVTICDFAADLRAPTPSAAAELLVPDAAELAAALRQTQQRLRFCMERALADGRQTLDRLSGKLRRPPSAFEKGKARYGEWKDRLERVKTGRLQAEKNRLSSLAGRLHALSPLAVLARGYTVVTAQGEMRPRAKDIAAGEVLTIRFVDGEVDGAVLRIRIKEREATPDEKKDDV